ncbi:sugar ABC transporter [Spirochaetia bacterium]|nr:sugar ABC transporter [Spirochaetia bacterium]
MAEVLKAEHIGICYAGMDVFKDVNLTVSAGEMHALIGRNASGKTTLGRIIAGQLAPTNGAVSFAGQTLQADWYKAEKLGIFMVEQNPALFPDLAIYDSITYGHEKLLFGSNIFMPSRAKIIAFTRDVLSRVGLDLDPSAKIGRLSEGELQLVNIGRILAYDPQVLILDEFSASLTWLEIKNVFTILRQLRDRGKCVFLLSHNLSEIPPECDWVSIFDRNGNLKTYTPAEARRIPLAKVMFGDNRSFKYPYLPVKRGKTALEVNLGRAGILQDISFKLYEGDLLGIAGLVGSGRSTLVKAIMDMLKTSGNRVFLYDIGASACQKRLGMVPENCDEAMFHWRNVGENVLIANLQKARKGPLLSALAEKVYARDVVDRFGINPGDISAYPHTLSSGNKQKVAIARLLFSNSGVFLFDEPTKNIDAAGKVDFYNIVNQLRMNGMAIVLISSDFSELIGICNRILVLRRGKQICEMNRDDATLEKLYVLANNDEEETLE